MNKTTLKKFYLLSEAIREVEESIMPTKYIQNGFVWFEDLWDELHELYKEFDNNEHTSLEALQMLVEDGWHWDFDLLTEEHLKKYSTKFTRWTVNFAEWELITNETDGEYEGILMSKEFKEECKYCFVPFNDVDEALDFMEARNWI